MFPIFKTKKYKDLDHKFVGTTMDKKKNTIAVSIQITLL